MTNHMNLPWLVAASSAAIVLVCVALTLLQLWN
jgi:hypothetical protein